MRIVHVTDAYLPKRGGIETQVHDLARHQQVAGHDVLVVTRVMGATHAEVPVYSAGDGQGHGPAAWVRTARRIEPALRGADQVHAHLSMISPAGLVGLRGATRLGLPAVATYHSVLPRAQSHGLPLSRLPFDPRAVAWTGVSEVAAASARALLGPGIAVDLLPNGLDLAPWRAVARTGPTHGDGHFTVVSVGRLAMRKRPFALIEVVARAQRLLRRGGSDVRLRLVLVGDGSWRPAVRAAALRRGVAGQVELTGGLERAAVAGVLARSHAFLSTATKESFGIAAMEARAAGLPVLARTGTGIAGLLEPGVEALFADDDAGLAVHLAALAGRPTLWSTLSGHNRAVPPQLGWDETLHLAELAYKRSADLLRPVVTA